jgi:hypothetical protein
VILTSMAAVAAADSMADSARTKSALAAIDVGRTLDVRVRDRPHEA